MNPYQTPKSELESLESKLTFEDKLERVCRTLFPAIVIGGLLFNTNNISKHYFDLNISSYLEPILTNSNLGIIGASMGLALGYLNQKYCQ